MQNVTVQTAQNVVIEYPIAGVGDRILATIADTLILIAIGLFLLFVVAPVVSDAGMVAPILLSIPFLFYHLICEVTMDGQSFGKKILHIRVVRLDGTAPTLGNYVMRWITRLFEVAMFSGMPALVAVLVSEKGQRLGDIAAGTCVVKLRPFELGETIFQAVDEAHEVRHPEVEKLEDRDIEIVKEVLRVYNKTGRTPQTNKLLERTIEVVSKKMGVTNDLPNPTFLRTVVKDYNHLAGNLSFEQFE